MSMEHSTYRVYQPYDEITVSHFQEHLKFCSVYQEQQSVNSCDVESEIDQVENRGVLPADILGDDIKGGYNGLRRWASWPFEVPAN